MHNLFAPPALATGQRASPHIRWMIARDMKEVVAIESASFEAPWAEEDFRRCLRQRNCIGMVIEERPGPEFVPLAGFMLYELHEDSLSVLNLAVRPDCRRRGFGRRLTEKLASKLSTRRRTRILADVREGNLPAQLFLRACRFRAECVLRGHYEDTAEDGYRFAYRLPGEG